MTLRDAEDWLRVRELFGAARKLDANARCRYLERACPDDPQLADEVRELLELADLGRDPIRAAIGQAALEITLRIRRS